MLQRAASNAYSWWYASHVRTKQSKWLEQSLQGMPYILHVPFRFFFSFMVLMFFTMRNALDEVKAK